MTRWYVKEFSALTQVSVQTLHHYDRIDLLKPSLRLENGYRVYSAADLLKLQQIIALKFFGFELAQIKQLLVSELNMREHFVAQTKLLEQKAEALLNASRKLKEITSAVQSDQSIPWQNIIETIEVFRMTEKMENSWVGKALSADELKQYVKFAKGLESRFTLAQKGEGEAVWFALLNDINANLQMDPASKNSLAIAERVMTWVKNIYGKEFTALRIAIWEKGFKGGDAATAHGLSQEAVMWVDKSVQALYRTKALAVLDQAGKIPDAELAQLWNALMEDRYHDCEERKTQFMHDALTEFEMNAAAKKFLLKKTDLVDKPN